MIEVKPAANDEWVITVRGSAVTRHRVRVSQAGLARFAEGRAAEELLVESFRFLLEREPNTSILGSFELSLICRYFPEYEQEIRRRLRKGSSPE